MSVYNNQFVNKKLIEKTLVSESKSYLREKTLGVECFKNAVVIPDSFSGLSGVYNDGIPDERSLLHIGWQNRKPCDFSGFDITFRDESAVYIGMFHFVWGHCITDNLKHLWFLLDKCGDDLRNLKFVYTVLNDNKIRNFDGGGYISVV